MQSKHSDSLLQNCPEDSPLSQQSQERVLVEAFEALPDAVYLFGFDRRLVKANQAAHLQNGELLPGKACCEMFWRVEGADGCVVDRALQTREKVEVEILAGPGGEDSISIVVEPLNTGDDAAPAALVIARDISDLRRAEAEAIAHKSFIASIADRTPDEIYALDGEGRITWMNERAEAYKLSMPLGDSFLDIVSADTNFNSLKVSPVFHWSDAEMEAYLKQHNLPNEWDYFDPAKADDKRECGLHAAWGGKAVAKT